MEAKIYPSNDVCMQGRELRRLRMAAGLSQGKLAKKMNWYRKRVERMENSEHFCLPSEEMQTILDILANPKKEETE